MKTKNLILLVIAMVMAFATTEVKANGTSQSVSELQYHPGLGRIAKWKANRVKRHMIKKQMKRRWMRPRHRGITIVL